MRYAIILNITEQGWLRMEKEDLHGLQTANLKTLGFPFFSFLKKKTTTTTMSKPLRSPISMTNVILRV